MNQAVKVAIGVGLALGTITIVYLGGQRIFEQQHLSDEIARLRDDLYLARITADRCRRSLANGGKRAARIRWPAALDACPGR